MPVREQKPFDEVDDDIDVGRWKSNAILTMAHGVEKLHKEREPDDRKWKELGELFDENPSWDNVPYYTVECFIENLEYIVEYRDLIENIYLECKNYWSTNSHTDCGEDCLYCKDRRWTYPVAR